MCLHLVSGAVLNVEVARDSFKALSVPPRRILSMTGVRELTLKGGAYKDMLSPPPSFLLIPDWAHRCLLVFPLLWKWREGEGWGGERLGKYSDILVSFRL